MKPIVFEKSNVNIAENQEEYQTLPAFIDRAGTITSCWELTPEELERVQDTGMIFLQQQAFGKPMQPVMITVENPLE